MAKQTKRGRSTTAPADTFVALRQGLRQSPAWRSLTHAARSVYIEMAAGVRRENNGRVKRSVRFLADVVPCAQSTVEAALEQLEDRGFVVAEVRGSLSPDGTGRATLWRLTEYGTVAEPVPTKDYKDWRPPKNKSPSRKSGRTVAKFRTVQRETAPIVGTGCPDIQDENGPFDAARCPEFRGKSILPGAPPRPRLDAHTGGRSAASSLKEG